MKNALTKNNFFEKATFESAQKDIFSIINKLINDETLKKLLFFTGKDALKQRNLTEEETMDLVHKHIRVVPQLPIQETQMSCVIITFDNYITNGNNPEFRDNTITFDVLCPMEHWVLDGYNLRPYRIMGEIDKMMDGQKLNGIGRAEFMSANQLLLSSDLGGFSLTYRTINDV